MLLFVGKNKKPPPCRQPRRRSPQRAIEFNVKNFKLFPHEIISNTTNRLLDIVWLAWEFINIEFFAILFEKYYCYGHWARVVESKSMISDRRFVFFFLVTLFYSLYCVCVSNLLKRFPIVNDHGGNKKITRMYELVVLGIEFCFFL